MRNWTWIEQQNKIADTKSSESNFIWLATDRPQINKNAYKSAFSLHIIIHIYIDFLNAHAF